MTPGTEERLAERNAILAQAATDPTKASLVNSGKLYAPHPYTNSPLTTPCPRGDELPLAGTLVPDFRLSPDGGLTTLRKVVGDRFTVIQTDATTPDMLTCYAIDGSGVTPLLTLKVDEGGSHLLAGAGSVAYLVRPDCYLAAVQPIEGGSSAGSWIDRIHAAWRLATAHETQREEEA
jgi:3-(3-hydroxy-phenyl)propionate hydroxylase